MPRQLETHAYAMASVAERLSFPPSLLMRRSQEGSMSVAGSAGTIVRRRIRVGGVVIAILGMILVPPCAEAQDKAQDKAPDRLGGHFGVVFPLVTRADGSTTGIGDNFKIG